MAKKKSGNLCTTLGCKTTSDAMLTIMLGLVLAVIVYFVAQKASTDSLNSSFTTIMDKVTGIIAVVTLVVILIEKLQRKMTMLEAGKKVALLLLYVIIKIGAVVFAKIIAQIFGLI